MDEITPEELKAALPKRVSWFRVRMSHSRLESVAGE